MGNRKGAFGGKQITNGMVSEKQRKSLRLKQKRSVRWDTGKERLRENSPCTDHSKKSRSCSNLLYPTGLLFPRKKENRKLRPVPSLLLCCVCVRKNRADYNHMHQVVSIDARFLASIDRAMNKLSTCCSDEDCRPFFSCCK